MNLIGTLAKVAMGVMVTRGVGKMLGRNSSGSGSAGASGGGLGGLLGGLLGGGQSGGSGGLGGLLGKALSGGQTGGAQSGGGLGGLLNGLGGGSEQARPGGTDFGSMLNEAMGGKRTPEPAPQANAQAEILLRGMINAAKADGQIDQAEQKKILEHLGDDVTQEEIDFVRNEMAQPLDVAGFVRSVPNGLQQHVYVMSLLGIDLDSKAEAQYLDQLARGLDISHELSNQIHAKVGVPALYS